MTGKWISIDAQGEEVSRRHCNVTARHGSVIERHQNVTTSIQVVVCALVALLLAFNVFTTLKLRDIQQQFDSLRLQVVNGPDWPMNSRDTEQSLDQALLVHDMDAPTMHADVKTTDTLVIPRAKLSMASDAVTSPHNRTQQPDMTYLSRNKRATGNGSEPHSQRTSKCTYSHACACPF